MPSEDLSLHSVDCLADSPANDSCTPSSSEELNVLVGEGVDVMFREMAGLERPLPEGRC